MKSQLKRSEYPLMFDEVMNIINTEPGMKKRMVASCLFWNGMRATEVCNYKIENINFERKFSDIVGKNNKIRTIPFLDRTFMLQLSAYIGKRKEGYVFLTKTGKKYYRFGINRILAQMARSADITNPNPLMVHVNPHCFRHSISNYLKINGYSVDFVQKFLGHARYETTMNMYSGITTEQMQKMVVRHTGDTKLLGSVSSHVPMVEDMR